MPSTFSSALFAGLFVSETIWWAVTLYKVACFFTEGLTGWEGLVGEGRVRRGKTAPPVGEGVGAAPREVGFREVSFQILI